MSLIQIGNDALAAVVERGGDDDDLMTVVERLFVQGLSEPCQKVLGEIASGSEATIDGVDVLRL